MGKKTRLDRFEAIANATDMPQKQSDLVGGTLSRMADNAKNKRDKAILKDLARAIIFRTAVKSSNPCPKK